jgi:hypothetical protein
MTKEASSNRAAKVWDESKPDLEKNMVIAPAGILQAII